MKKRTILISAAVVLVLGIIAVFNFPRPITALHINSGTVRLESDMSKALNINVKPEKAYSFQYKLVSDNEFVAFCESNCVYAVNEGETYVYATSSDGKTVSNKIKVVVSNDIFEIASLILSDEDNSSQKDSEAEITVEKINQITDGTIAKTDISTAPKTSSEEIPEPAQSDQSDIVYVTASGTKFHSAACSYAKTASPVPRSEAISEGKTPCKKCNP